MGDTPVRGAVALMPWMLWWLACMALLHTEVLGQQPPKSQASGGGCSPTVIAGQLHVTIVCEGIEPQVLQPLNAVLDTTDLDLHGKIRQAEAWARLHHAVVQVLAEAQGD